MDPAPTPNPVADGKLIKMVRNVLESAFIVWLEHV